MGFHPGTNDLCIKAFQSAEALSMAIVSTVGGLDPNDGTHALVGAVAAVGGALKTLASLISEGEPGEDIADKATKESLLVAALIAARVMMPSPAIKGGFVLDFSPRNVVAGIEAACKVAGENMRPFVNKYMLASYDAGIARDELTLGYWDYLRDVGPSFEGFDGLVNYTKH